MTLKKARPEDSARVLEWRNEPTTWPWMGRPEMIPFAEHDPWFQKAIFSENCLFFIVEVNGCPVGQLRYEREDKSAKVSLNISRKTQSRGVGTRAFELGSAMVRKLDFARAITAHVQVDNLPCIRACEKAGYRRHGAVTLRGAEHVLLVHELEAE